MPFSPLHIIPTSTRVALLRKDVLVRQRHGFGQSGESKRANIQGIRRVASPRKVVGTNTRHLSYNGEIQEKKKEENSSEQDNTLWLLLKNTLQPHEGNSTDNPEPARSPPYEMQKGVQSTRNNNCKWQARYAVSGSCGHPTPPPEFQTHHFGAKKKKVQTNTAVQCPLHKLYSLAPNMHILQRQATTSTQDQWRAPMSKQGGHRRKEGYTKKKKKEQ